MEAETKTETPKFLISRTPPFRHVNVQQILPDGSLRFRGDVGTSFCSVNVARNRIDTLFPGAEKVIRL